MVGKGNRHGQTYVDIGWGRSPCVVKRSSVLFSNGAYVGSQGKSTCETQKHLHLDFLTSKG